MKLMRSNTFLAVTLLLLSTLFGKNAVAQNPVVHITPEPAWLNFCSAYDKRPNERSIENGYFIELLERQIDVERKADYHHVIRDIVSEAGIQNGSQLAVGFDPSYQRLDFHQITIWRNGKPQNRLNPADFKIIADEEDFSKFIYQGSYSANYILPDIRKGDRIEYSYTLTGYNPVFGAKFCENLYLQAGQVIAHQFVVLQSSSSRKLNIKSFNGVPKVAIAEKNGVKRYEWENFMVKPVDDESTQPSWFDPYARVEVSEYNTWGEVIDWALKVNPVSSNLSGELAQRVAKLKAEAKGDKEKYFRAAVKTVQDEVRYMGIEIGEYSHRANHPENVFNQRYGDCKDKALLLSSMLRADGIPADMVLVNTNLQDKIDQLLPTTDAFNHAVVAANLNGKRVWVDATIAYQRGKGTDLYFPNYGKGLELKAGNNGLVAIPLTKTGKIISHEKYTVTGVSKNVRLDVKTIYTLNQAEDVRARLASAGLYSTEKNYLKYYAKLFPKIQTRDSLTVKDDEEKNELTTMESYSIPEFFKKDSVTDKYEVSFYGNPIDDELPNIGGQTKNPVALDYPYSVDHTLEISLPEGWNLEDRNYSLKRDAYEFNSDYTTVGNSRMIHYQFAFLKDFLPTSQVDQARKDFALMRDSKLAYNFTYTPGEAESHAGVPAPVNVWMVIAAGLTVIVCAGFAIWLYHLRTPELILAPYSYFVPIGGWLIVAAILLFITPLAVLNSFFKNDFFSLSAWNVYAHQSGNVLFRCTLMMECIGNTIIICISIFCLVLFFNKRDITPRVMTGYYIFCVCLSLADYILLLFLHQGKPSNVSTASALFGTIIKAGIIIAYLKQSTRVKETFIVPHPAYNFRYAKPVEPTEPTQN